MSVAHDFNLDNSDFDEAAVFIAGVECEMESVMLPAPTFPNFVTTEDGSLRNSGLEFISYPLPKDKLLSSFKNLHANIVFYKRDEAFSSRTSTHVHINCRSLSSKEVKNLMLLYALYEEFFFLMVNTDRRDNIHCVPLTETYLPTAYNRSLNSLVTNWHKYTALNLLPLKKLGTVEFRHLQGTEDVVLFEEWVQLLENLWLMCQDVELSREIVTNEQILLQVWQRLFGHVPRIMALEVSFSAMIANPLLDIKLAFL